MSYRPGCPQTYDSPTSDTECSDYRHASSCLATWYLLETLEPAAWAPPMLCPSVCMPSPFISFNFHKNISLPSIVPQIPSSYVFKPKTNSSVMPMFKEKEVHKSSVIWNKVQTQLTSKLCFRFPEGKTDFLQALTSTLDKWTAIPSLIKLGFIYEICNLFFLINT